MSHGVLPETLEKCQESLPESTLQPDSQTEMRFTTLAEEGTMKAQAWKTFCSGILPRTDCVSPCVSTGYIIVHVSINLPVFFIHNWDSNVWLVLGSQYLRHNLGSKSNPGPSEKPDGAALVMGSICVCISWWFTLSKYEYFALLAAALDPRGKSEAGAAVS